MHISRRNFLGLSGATAFAACAPGAFSAQPLLNVLPDTFVPSDLKGLQTLARQRTRMLGYPVNMNIPPAAFFEWRQKLHEAGLNQFHFNNVGDPFKHSHFGFNTHDFERELIERFGQLYGFGHNNIWGFLSHSGTDSNMHGLFIGRTVLQSRTGVMPKIYFTREAHYSIQILAHLLNLERIEVDTMADGSMNIADFEIRLKANPNHPALVVATIGTTFKGAVDSIDAIQNKLAGRVSYLHLDAALFGGYLPHTAFADELLHTGSTGQIRYHSIAVSCHKFFGFPAPAGLFITTRAIFDEFEVQFGKMHNPEYLLQIPGTITCSRDAVKPAEFHFYSSAQEFSRQAHDARNMLEATDYLLHKMQIRFSHLTPMRSNPRSVIIYFRKPADSIVERYTLATMTSGKSGNTGDATSYAHVVVMPHVSKRIIDYFLSDLSKSGS
jgi:histidine decarboxylase